jgi:hypothetical protein
VLITGLDRSLRLIREEVEEMVSLLAKNNWVSNLLLSTSLCSIIVYFVISVDP